MKVLKSHMQTGNENPAFSISLLSFLGLRFSLNIPVPHSRP